MDAPTTTAPAPSTQPNPPGPNMAESFAGFDALVAAPESSPSPPAGGEGRGEGQASDAQPSTTNPQPPTKPAPDTKPTDEGKPPSTLNPQPSTKPAKAATLREELDRTRTEAADWRGKYEKLQADLSKPKPDPEKDQLLKDRETWNKSRADLENELKFANYERSQEYKDKYQQPFLKAYESAQKLVSALTVKEPDQKDQYGEVTEPGKTRKGTEADWDALMAITDENAASEFIAEHFGHSAARVTVLRDKVLDLHGQMRAAVEDFRKQAGERETQMRGTLEKQQKEISTRWHAANAHAAQKYPQYFAPDPADPKATALWEAGTRLTDLAFGVLDPADVSKLPPAIQSKFVNGQLPLADRTLLHSAIRNRAAAYDRLVYKLAMSEAAKKELADKLAGFEKSEPGRGQARKVETSGKPGTPSTLDEVDSAFDQLAAANG
jgi:hypothetical protein